MDEVRRKLRSFSDAAATEGKFLDWFERLYEHADNNPVWIPWSKGQPHPLLVDWMKETNQTAGTALVVVTPKVSKPTCERLKNFFETRVKGVTVIEASFLNGEPVE